MEVIKTELEDCYIIVPQKFGDHRGWFMESYSKKEFEKNGLNYEFVQDNGSYTKTKGTIRGLHFQTDPMCQAKLVRVTQGAVYDIVVDLREDSPTYLKWISVELSKENNKQLLVPRGFAHGFVTITDDVEFVYKVDNYYSKEHEGGFIWNDPDFNIDWGFENPILSEKDEILPLYKDTNVIFRRKK